MEQKRTGKTGGLRRNAAFKSLMVLVYVLSIIGMVGGCLFTIEFGEGGLYTGQRDGLSKQRLEDLCRQEIFALNSRYQEMLNNGYYDESLSADYREQLYHELMDPYDPAQSNFEFIISDKNENPLFQSFTNGSYRYSRTEPHYETTYKTIFENQRMKPEEWDQYFAHHSDEGIEYSIEEVLVWEIVQPETVFPPSVEGTPNEPALEETDVENVPNEVEREVLYYDVTVSKPETTLEYYITGYVRSDLSVNDRFAQYEKFIDLAYDYRYVPFIVMIVSAAAFLASLIFLIAAAGYRKGHSTAAEGVFDKIPYDAFTVMQLILGVIVIVFFDEVVNAFGGLMMAALVCAGLISGGLIVLWWLCSTAVRLRTGRILSNNLLVITAKVITRMLRRYSNAVFGLPLLWQIPLGAFGFFLVQMLCMMMVWNGNEFGLFPILMLYVAAVVIACMIAASLHHLEKGAERIASGDLTHKIPEEKLAAPFKKHGRYLNSIGEGMNVAVNERIKSEMFKTELIANVSHDIRTPLTSIINYTDLLSKLELKDPKAVEYLEVLTRQSARLRKLTEDVLEASKATTGNMKVQKEKMDLRVLLEQIQGEYAEKLEVKSLQMVCNIPDQPLFITADGRLLWRVMDNLFGNVCKYALQNTRVYLDAFSENGKVTMTLRNISAVQLHISADALMERFVQGDRSRNTEGSGLGLSIAQSLTNLQGGTLKIAIDGDLFKVTLSFEETVF